MKKISIFFRIIITIYYNIYLVSIKLIKLFFFHEIEYHFEMRLFIILIILFHFIFSVCGRNFNFPQTLVVSNRNFVYSSDNVGEIPNHQTVYSTTENVLTRLKSIAHLRTADTKKPTVDTMTREELEALRDLLDKNLQKYQNFNEHSFRKRPNDPYISQILQNLNGNGGNNNHNHDHNNNDMIVEQQQQYRQIPIRRKIIRHTVFTSPLGGAASGDGNSNRVMYGSGDMVSRIDWSSPFAEYFPILIKDPFQTMMNSFSEIIEYGPAADICRHTTRSGGGDEAANDLDDGVRKTRMSGDGTRTAEADDTGPEPRLRRSRRNTGASPSMMASVAGGNEDAKGVLNHVRPLRPHLLHGTTSTTEQPKHHWVPDKAAAEHNGDTGPQIKRLVVRRGGVAIAGPGGIATAGSGGTAIVGPGGSAYSSKDTASGATSDSAPISPGVSMAGYGPQVMQGPPGYFSGYPHGGFGRSVAGRSAGTGGTAVLSSDGVTYKFPVPSRGLTAIGGLPINRRDDRDIRPYAASSAREITLPDGAKLIATGPIVYYNPEPSPPATVLVQKKKSRKGKKSSSSKKHRGVDSRQSV